MNLMTDGQHGNTTNVLLIAADSGYFLQLTVFLSTELIVTAMYCFLL